MSTPHRSTRAVLRTAVMSLAAVALAACPQHAAPDGEADGSVDELELFDGTDPEAGPRDHDGDGLCDTTELTYGTDPDDPDTDHDGLLDSLEFDAYTSPLSATDPSADERVTLREEPGSSAPSFVQFAYRGIGESLTGLMLDRVIGVDERGPNEFVGAIEALTADPRAGVADLIGPRFTSVNGIVRLRWMYTLAWPAAAAPIGCRRAYVGLPAVFAEGRGLVYARTLVIDVLGSDRAGGLDAGTATDASSDTDGATASGPRWPFVSRGLCLPRPGACR